MIRHHRATSAVAVGGLLASTLLLPAVAQAAPDSPAAAPHVAVTTGISGTAAGALAESLGKSRSGGVYRDGSGRIVVAVTDQVAARAVQEAGGVPRLVTYSMATLESIHTELDQLAGIPGTSWGVDPSTNQVSVELDSAVSPANAAKLTAAAGAFGGAVRVERISGKIEQGQIYTAGGDAIRNHSGSVSCSLGFNVQTASGNKHFLTAGHCVTGTKDWYDTVGGVFIGSRTSYSYPDNDWAVIDYTPSYVTALGTVADNTQQITGSRYPVDGEEVARYGATSVDNQGQVLLTSTTVTYSNGAILHGVIKTSNCMKRGDSGGPLYHGPTALGITSGGNGLDDPCSSGVSDRRSYYQPVQEVLSAKGLYVY